MKQSNTPGILPEFKQYPRKFPLNDNKYIYYILLYWVLVELMSVIRQLRHKCYSIPLHLHVVSSNKSAGILPYDSLECYNNVKSSAACFGGWHGIFFHSFVSRIWWFSTIRIKYTSEVWRLFKYEYHSKPCALLITLLGYPLSNASVFADIIFKIIMNQCDCKKTRNEQSITFQIYVIWQSNTTFYYIYIWHLKIMTITCFGFPS